MARDDRGEIEHDVVLELGAMTTSKFSAPWQMRQFAPMDCELNRQENEFWTL